MTRRADLAWEVVAAVPDPEMPFLNLGDLGILRSTAEQDGTVVVTLTPTYSGCPAMTEMVREVRRRLDAADLDPVDIRTALVPAWTTEWISSTARQKLLAAGVAPPNPAPRPGAAVPVSLVARPSIVRCPLCGSSDTVEQSHFGATACKALHRCNACSEPFEHMKAI